MHILVCKAQGKYVLRESGSEPPRGFLKILASDMQSGIDFGKF